MDVLVTMHYKFQQSSPIYSGRYLRLRSSTECWTAQFLGWSSTCPLVCKRQGFGQTVKKTAVPQLLSSDKVVDVPGVRVVQILRCRCGGDSRLPQLQLVAKSVEIPHVFLDKDVDMPVGVYNRCLVFWCRNCGLSAVAVHRQL